MALCAASEVVLNFSVWGKNGPTTRGHALSRNSPKCVSSSTKLQLSRIISKVLAELREKSHNLPQHA